MKNRYTVLILLWGTGREVYVSAFTPSQAISLAKMQATPAELAGGKFEVINA